MKLPHDFNCDNYRYLNNDLKDLADEDLKDHYIKFGYYENRIYKINLPHNFNCDNYRYLYKDLKDLADEDLKDHYIKFGYYENRIYKINLPENFNVNRYKILNYDLLNMNEYELTYHYVNYGYFENRMYNNIFLDNFDIDIYIKKYNLSELNEYELTKHFLLNYPSNNCDLDDNVISPNFDKEVYIKKYNLSELNDYELKKHYLLNYPNNNCDLDDNVISLNFDKEVYVKKYNLSELNEYELKKHYFLYAEINNLNDVVNNTLIPYNFNTNIYKLNYDDLINFNEYELKRHYFLYGNNENRIYEYELTTFKYPRILHLFWYGDLPFINYITILSFIKYHHNWKIKIYTTNVTIKKLTWDTHEQQNNPECQYNFFTKLNNIKNVEIINIDKLVNELNLGHLNFIHQSDILRIYFLYIDGGIWSDFDIIYTKNIEEIFKDDKDIIFEIHSSRNYTYYPIGFFLSQKKSNLFKYIFDYAMSKINETKLGYETFGASMFETLINHHDLKNKFDIIILDKKYYLYFEWFEVDNLYEKINLDYPKETIGIHWFNGHSDSKKYISQFNYKKINKICTMDYLLSDYMNTILEIMNGNSLNTFFENIPLYWINLDRSVDRKKFMNDQLMKYKNNYRIQAIDGSNSDFNNYNIKFEIDRSFSINMKAVYCSHINAIKKAYDNGDNVAIILEDDANLHLIDIYNYNMKYILSIAPDNWSILQLYGIDDKKVLTNLLNDHTINGLRWVNRCFYGSASGSAYLINRIGMNNILNKCITNFNYDYTFLNNNCYDIEDFIFNQEGSYILNYPFLYYYFDTQTFINYINTNDTELYIQKDYVQKIHKINQNTLLTYTQHYKKISIVIAYINRKPQILFTLKTINESKYKNIEVIIVDDGSDDDQKLNDIINNFDFKIILVEIDKNEKKWLNPCVAYNIGFKKASGDIIIIQNPEVCHIGDCITFISNNLIKGDWLSFNCYGLNDFNDNDNLYKLFKESEFNNIYDFIYNRDNIIGGNSVHNDNPGGWINHYQKLFVAYHYLAAIYKDDLFKKMNGGFYDGYRHGICWDDNDFIKYLIYNNFKFKIPFFEKNLPFAIHQYHEKTQSLLKNKEDSHYINRLVFNKRMDDINVNYEIDISSGFMPSPILLK